MAEQTPVTRTEDDRSDLRREEATVVDDSTTVDDTDLNHALSAAMKPTAAAAPVAHHPHCVAKNASVSPTPSFTKSQYTCATSAAPAPVSAAISESSQFHHQLAKHQQRKRHTRVNSDLISEEEDRSHLESSPSDHHSAGLPVLLSVMNPHQMHQCESDDNVRLPTAMMSAMVSEASALRSRMDFDPKATGDDPSAPPRKRRPRALSSASSAPLHCSSSKIPPPSSSSSSKTTTSNVSNIRRRCRKSKSPMPPDLFEEEQGSSEANGSSVHGSSPDSCSVCASEESSSGSSEKLMKCRRVRRKLNDASPQDCSTSMRCEGDRIASHSDSSMPRQQHSLRRHLFRSPMRPLSDKERDACDGLLQLQKGRPLGYHQRTLSAPSRRLSHDFSALIKRKPFPSEGSLSPLRCSHHAFPAVPGPFDYPSMAVPLARTHLRSLDVRSLAPSSHHSRSSFPNSSVSCSSSSSSLMNFTGVTHLSSLMEPMLIDSILQPFHHGIPVQIDIDDDDTSVPDSTPSLDLFASNPPSSDESPANMDDDDCDNDDCDDSDDHQSTLPRNSGTTLRRLRSAVTSRHLAPKKLEDLPNDVHGLILEFLSLGDAVRWSQSSQWWYRSSESYPGILALLSVLQPRVHHFAGISEDDLHSLLLRCGSSRLRCVDLTYVSAAVRDHHLNVLLKQCDQLQSLILFNCHSLSHTGLSDFFDRACLSCLNHLCVSGVSEFNSDCFTSVAQRCTQLRTLDLSWCSEVDSETVAHYLAEMVNRENKDEGLRWLNVFECNRFNSFYFALSDALNIPDRIEYFNSLEREKNRSLTKKKKRKDHSVKYGGFYSNDTRGFRRRRKCVRLARPALNYGLTMVGGLDRTGTYMSQITRQVDELARYGNIECLESDIKSICQRQWALKCEALSQANWITSEDKYIYKVPISRKIYSVFSTDNGFCFGIKFSPTKDFDGKNRKQHRQKLIKMSKEEFMCEYLKKQAKVSEWPWTDGYQGIRAFVMVGMETNSWIKFSMETHLKKRRRAKELRMQWLDFESDTDHDVPLKKTTRSGDS